MARTKKISVEQFVLDCINKEFEIVGSNLHWDTFDDLKEWTTQNKDWPETNSFTTKEQYLEWKEYFLTHFYNWQPKRVSINMAKKDFAWFALDYGFKYDFDTSEL